MTTITLSDFYTNIKQYIQLVLKGEEIIISEKDKPLFQLEPLKRRKKSLRPYGLCAGEIKISPDFDKPLPDEIIKSFE
ncbi:MAG: prevent-host-death protein [Bacteroidetes bacterium CG23_combo_of_CG06-09_8_20_14_all_32_9]|nr:MAG: prevent-host-death protein [Bacteroidetes bacterium CG23_combo_of_CG06-09_8_20_14_all_32_9]